MKLNANYLKIFADLLIPVLGFVWWNWNLYFILIFLLLDFFISEVLIHLKTKKIKSYSEKVDKSQWIKYSIFSILLVGMIVFGIHLAMFNIHHQISFKSEIYNFLTYEEMGVSQGIIFLPLLVMMGYSQYKSEFIMPKLYQIITFEKIWKDHFFIHFALLAFILLMCILTAFTHFSEGFYLAILLISIVGFKLFQLRQSFI